MELNMKLVGFKIAAWRFVLCACLALGHAGLALADDILDVSALVRAGQYEQALQRADAYLATRPRNVPQMRFLKGLILTEQGKTNDAITMFVRLSEDYPELPEPYNNLAVLYASQGQFEKARAALEMAIRTHPSYATAHENLGDVYAKLASQAYDKALQLDSANSNAQTKLALIRDLIGSNGQRPPPKVAPAAAPAAAVKAAEPPKVAPAAAPAAATKAAEPPKVAPAAAPAAATKAVEPPKVALAAGAPKPVDAPKVGEAPKAAVPAKVGEPAKAAESKAEAARGNDNAEALAAIQAWVRAWAAQDMHGYLGAYANDFQVPRGLTRAAWEKERRARIVGRAKIVVTLDDIKISTENGATTVKFRQHYKSDQLTTSSNKTLTLTKMNGKWLIKQERTG